MSNETLKRAVIRSLEIIRGATKNLSEDSRKKHSDKAVANPVLTRSHKTG